ncbi:MAG: ankyrin repeat domain-containing protein [Chlamydiales bacterium]|nr:ankyrin repeat domain-containing protein [Chlamydiales bacterium]
MKHRITAAIVIATAFILFPTSVEAKSKKNPQKMSQAQLATKMKESTQELNAKLLVAAFEGNAKECEQLIKAGAEINTQTQNGDTPLLLAIRENHIQIVKALLSFEADCCLANRAGIFPLAQVVVNGDKAVPKELDDGKIIYVKSDFKIHPFLATALLINGARIDQQDMQGRSALHLAAEAGNVEAINFLVDHEANVDIRDVNGRSPLMYACKSGGLECCKQLLLAKSDVNAKDNDGQTPLMFAVQKDQPEMVTHLINKGAVINDADDFGATALKISDALGNRKTSDCLRKTGG